MKKAVKEINQIQFRIHKSYSAEEILAAGGTTAFARKIGVSGKEQMEAIAKIPAISFSDSEWNDLLEMLKKDK